MSDVKLLALWDGWCDPCGLERPLALTEHGPRGVRAWLTGVGIEDRSLVLACEVCGQWQAVPQLEEDDPEVAETAVPPILATAILPSRFSIVLVPADRPEARRDVPEPRGAGADTTEAALLSLLADGLDVVSAHAA